MRCVERALQRRDRLRTIRRAHDQLGQHRIVKALTFVPVSTQVSMRASDGNFAAVNKPALGRKLLRGIFRIEPRLMESPVGLRRRRVEKRIIAACATDHPFDQIDAPHFFGVTPCSTCSRVFTSERRSRLGRHHKEIQPYRQSDTSRPASGLSALSISAARVASERCGRRRLLNHFLIAALQRSNRAPPSAITRPAPSPNACTSMCRAPHEAFQENAAVRKIAFAPNV